MLCFTTFRCKLIISGGEFLFEMIILMRGREGRTDIEKKTLQDVQPVSCKASVSTDL